MRELTYKNQHEIGFDIDCLPKWAKYIAVDEDGEWYYYSYVPKPYNHLIKSVWFSHRERRSQIHQKYTPKKFTGNWEESLFKINRESSVHYNGTAI